MLVFPRSSRIKWSLIGGLAMCVMACASERSKLQNAWLTAPYTSEELIELYHQADTVISRNDSVLIVNTRRDTVIVETGIFTYLQYGYPLATPYALIALTRQAEVAERAADQAEAVHCYQAVVDYFNYEWLVRKAGFENGGFSDLNDLLSHNVNVRVLVSNAYEKLGRLPEALAVLAPYLASVEAERSKIQQRYVELCVRHYGKAATQMALDRSGQTVCKADYPEMPEKDYWCVTVFGAPLSVADFNTETLTAQAAQQLVYQQPYYALVNQPGHKKSGQ